MKNLIMIMMETLIILAYCYSNILGMVFMLVVVICKLFFLKERNMIKFFELMIMALPMAYIGIAGIKMHQLFSWYNVFLVCFFIAVLYNYLWKVSIHHIAAVQLIVIFFLLFLNLPYSDDVKKTFVEMAQIFIMLIPIVMFHSVKKSLRIGKAEIQELISMYVNVCVSTAIAMLVQYVLYFFVHIQIGIIDTFGSGRVSCQCLFKGASILPIFMGIGMIILFLDMLDTHMTISCILEMVVIFLAVVLNSSRTALFMIIVVLAFVCMRQMLKRPGIKPLFITLVGLFASIGGIQYIISLRSGLNGFLDANGRVETWINSINVWLADIKNFLIGGGLADGSIKSHNFPIQTLAQCGILVSLIVFIMIFVYLWNNRKNRYKYVIWFVLLSGFLVTDFYANAFTTVIFILVDLYGTSELDATRKELLI